MRSVNRQRLGLSVAASIVLSLTGSHAPAQCQRAKLTAYDAETADWFGYSVSVSHEAVVVGAPFEDEGGHNYGAAYVFERSGAEWSLVHKLFPADDGGLVGRSVAVDGDVAVLGATSAWTSVFERSDGVWTHVADLVPDEQHPTYIGLSVAVSADRAVVGAPHDDDNGTDSGAAYVFERDPNGVWSQAAKLLADDGQVGDSFGDAVAIDGDVAVIGAQDDDDLGNWSGSAYVFERDPNGAWLQTPKLLPHDGAGFWNFGTSVAVSGDLALVGADNAYGIAPYTGAAYVFERDPNGAWLETAKLIADDGANSDRFGASVGLSGDVGVIGAWGDDDHGEHTGAAYVFVRQPDHSWTQIDKFTADDGAADDRFGNAVAVNGNVAVIGAYMDDDHGEDSGSAYVFAVGPDSDGNGIMDACECRGDLDSDRDVDLADLAILLSNYGMTSGATYEDGDLDGDGDVDLTDLADLLGNYGTICP